MTSSYDAAMVSLFSSGGSKLAVMDTAGLVESARGIPATLPSLSALQQAPMAAVREWYVSCANPMQSALVLAGVLSAVVWLLGEITGNVSQVDRLWTFLPVLFAAHWTIAPWVQLDGARGGWQAFLDSTDERMRLMLVLLLLWSARLTTNTYRRGFFNPKSEDYRWPIVRDALPKLAFELFHLTFIAFTQVYFLLAATAPFYVILARGPSAKAVPLGLVDGSLAALYVLILVLEMVADNQQQAYQSLKHSGGFATTSTGVSDPSVARGKIARGFVTDGLWAWCRHPNFACEQATWYVLYAFTLVSVMRDDAWPRLVELARQDPRDVLRALESGLHAAKSLKKDHLTRDLPERALALVPTSTAELQALLSGLREAAHESPYVNWSVCSPLGMSVLFLSSTALTEHISSRKYALYREYQRRVAMFLPPLTPLKGFWLLITAQRKRVDRLVFGDADDVPSIKKRS